MKTIISRSVLFYVIFLGAIIGHGADRDTTSQKGSVGLRFTPEPEGRRQIMVESRDGSFRWRLRAPERIFCDEGVLVGHDIWRVHTPVSWSNPGEGVWLFERNNKDDTAGAVKHSIDYQLQIDPMPYGALLTLSVKNTGEEALHNIVGHICLGHLSDPFRDPSFQRSYLRLDGEFRSLQETNRGSDPIRAHYRVSGFPAIKLFNNPDNRFWGAPSPEQADSGLILTLSESKENLVALWFDPAGEVFQNSDEPNMCIHSDPFFGDLQPGSSKEVQGKLILFNGTLSEFETKFLP
ncbi:MAG: hypothetical protein O3C43_01050 [Verrucomicrobia bacterium]|nr:hypothetical protein [Verrucomicrobiota bacterium]MDA1065066.1 hypothetical protein [Verrucomicrobiota bacterium]